MFTDQNGNDYDFYDDGNKQVHEVFKDINPTDSYDQQVHYGEWFNLTYKTTTIERYDGSTGNYYDDDVLVIVVAEPAN